MKNILEIIKLLDISIKEDANNLLTGWNIIKTWYDKKIDNYRDFINNSKDWLIDYQIKLQKETNIQKLKIKYTNILWYFIEIPKSSLKYIKEDFIHKQTLVNVARFVTKELKEFEQKIIEWENFLFEREYDIFQEIREEILSNFWELKNLSKNIAFLDFWVSLANVAYNHNFSKPTLSYDSELIIKRGRHPIIESNWQEFISNDLSLNSSNYINIITWPNMWWKSTFLRQNALIILLSHIWSYVPAKKAIIPLTDKIFSRVWAQDNLYLWQSTFMVEMQEVANILNNSTKKSFIIIDEVWRWTSTYDGMSLAWAILKYLHDKIKAKVLFATHYHELTKKSWLLKWVKNYSVAVWENSDNLIFLRKVIPWWIKKSYWIEVAQIAWLSNNVILEAKKMLKTLEKIEDKDNYQLSLWDFNTNNSSKIEIIYKDSILNKELDKLDVNNLTPLEAINELNRLKDILKNNN